MGQGQQKSQEGHLQLLATSSVNPSMSWLHDLKAMISQDMACVTGQEFAGFWGMNLRNDREAFCAAC